MSATDAAIVVLAVWQFGVAIWLGLGQSSILRQVRSLRVQVEALHDDLTNVPPPVAVGPRTMRVVSPAVMAEQLRRMTS